MKYQATQSTENGIVTYLSETVEGLAKLAHAHILVFGHSNQIAGEKATLERHVFASFQKAIDGIHGEHIKRYGFTVTTI